MHEIEYCTVRKTRNRVLSLLFFFNQEIKYQKLQKEQATEKSFKEKSKPHSVKDIPEKLDSKYFDLVNVKYLVVGIFCVKKL